MTDQWLIVLMLLVPVAGSLGAMAASPRLGAGVRQSSSVALIGLAVIWPGCSLSGLIDAPTQWNAGTWLTIPAGAGIPVELSFLLDGPRSLLVFLAGWMSLWMSLCEATGFADSGRLVGTDGSQRRADEQDFRLLESSPYREVSLTLTSLLLPLAIIAILAENLVVVLMAWMAADAVLCLSSRSSGSSLSSGSMTGGTARAARTSTAWRVDIVRCSSVFLLGATLLILARFETGSLDALPAEIVADGEPDLRSVLSGIVVLFAVAIAGRCGLSPFLPWVQGGTEPDAVQSEFSAGATGVAGVLPGISLGMWILPLAGSVGDSFLLLAALGVVSVLVAGISLVQADFDSAATPLIVGAGGMACAALATARPESASVAAGLLVSQLIAVTVLAGRPRSRMTRGIALTLAVSGVWGANAALAMVETLMRRPIDAESPKLYGSWLIPAIWWGLILGQAYWGYVVVRVFYRFMPDRVSSEARSRTRRDPSAAGMAGGATGGVPGGETVHHDRMRDGILLLAACLGVCVGLLPAGPDSRGLIAFGAATPACLLGAVSAWLVSRAGAKESASTDRRSGSVQALYRKYRDWYGMDVYWRVGLVAPVRFLARAVEIIDRRILGGTREEAWRNNAARLAEAIEHLRRQPPVYYGLTMLLVLVGLLWSMS